MVYVIIWLTANGVSIHSVSIHLPVNTIFFRNKQRIILFNL